MKDLTERLQREAREEFIAAQMVELTYGDGTKHRVYSLDKKIAEGVANWWLDKLAKAIEQAVVAERERALQEAIDLSEQCELGDLPEWRAFKRFRNTLRDRLEALTDKSL